ncbi:MAG: O-succinylbenzoate--CoA ligase [Bdellovibrio sp. ArHS]|uniref:AMP-binding protein n=1 Tax=Bdellovibrio sp. ArHS TaxID=1569284 RepID=UPI000582C16B|nr:AMP-binding protein [Bdellovibrio sp. ArHS]KHD89700.1 MAG: O-succinylbenzoate--CoA ligase [Bdellovibrio sp. ArHS]
MASAQEKLDLFSTANEILLNPRLPREDYEALYALAENVQKEKQLQGHVWLATSGSTAESAARTKLVALSKKALLSSAEAVNQHLQSTSNDVWTQVLPHFHVGGLGIEVRAELAGARVVSALKDGRWDTDHFYKILFQERCTLSALVPTQVYDLVARSLPAPPLIRAIVVGGGAFEVELFKKARALGWPVLPSYGMTETASQIATARLQSLTESDFPEMVLLSHAQARKNEDGFLQVQATSLFTCYAQNSAQQARWWDPKVDGWFTTEDRGEVIQGALHIQGRSKDYIKIGGEGTNVAHLRSILENCALSVSPDFPLKMTLLDMPSERLGSEIHIVSLLSQEETENIVKIFSEKVLPFEKPRKIHYAKEIPRSDLGKILWAQLRNSL